MDLNYQGASDTSTNNSGGKAISYDEIMEKDILDLMGAENMTDKEKEDLYKQMIETIQNRVIAKISDKIADEEVEEVRKAVEAGDKNKFFEILKTKGIDVEKIYAEEAFIYKVQMVNLINQGKSDERN